MFNCFRKMFTCMSHNDKSLAINNFSLSLSIKRKKTIKRVKALYIYESAILFGTSSLGLKLCRNQAPLVCIY